MTTTSQVLLACQAQRDAEGWRAQKRKQAVGRGQYRAATTESGQNHLRQRVAFAMNQTIIIGHPLTQVVLTDRVDACSFSSTPSG